MRRGRAWRLAALLMVASLTLSVDARPYRGRVEWDVLLCNFRGSGSGSGSGSPPRAASWYRSLVVTSGIGSLNDYWSAVSYGGVTLNGTVVAGWCGPKLRKFTQR